MADAICFTAELSFEPIPVREAWNISRTPDPLVNIIAS